MVNLKKIVVLVLIFLLTIFMNTLICTAASTSSLNITFENITFDFDPDVYEYDLEVENEIKTLIPKVTMDNHDIKFEISNNDKIYIGNNKIIVKVNNLVYKFNVTRKNGLPSRTATTFSHQAGVQVFNVLEDGNYKIELWGARGGNFGSYLGGYGAYTTGNIELQKGDTLYFYVGSMGSDTMALGGYNGGGTLPGEQMKYGRAGGGATDVRLVDGNWNDFESLKSRIMVAAGGGGANYRSEGYGEGNGGSGGGLIGYDGISVNSTNSYGHGFATGGTQTTGGKFSWTGTQVSPKVPDGSFGYGGGSTTLSVQGGGGGGYYGGASNQHGGGGGGSSFISGHAGCEAILLSSTESNIVSSGNSEHYSGKKFTNTLMIDGNGYSWTNEKTNLELMPNPDGGEYASGYGNLGNGFAKITNLIEGDDNNYLADLTLSAGNFVFDKNVLEYDISLDEDDTLLEVRGIPEHINAIVLGNDTYEIAVGDNVVNISVTAVDGTTRIYTLNINRPMSSNSNLKGIKINGELLESFQEDVLDYDVIIPYDTKTVNVEGVLANINQTITGEGVEVVVDNVAEAKLFVVSEDKSTNKLYTINFTKEKSTLLEKIAIEEANFELELEKDKFEYEIAISKRFHEVVLDVTPYYQGVKIEVAGNKYIGERNNIITVTSSLDGEVTRVYTFKVVYIQDVTIETNDFNYTGGYQTFIAPSTGIYRVELWGARGGNIASYQGGKGAYTAGNINLERNDVLYIYVGGMGSDYNNFGGYNGGGMIPYNQIGYGRVGGGATDVRLVDGSWNDFESLKSRIMVAAGGGGANYRSQGYGEGNGGAGGGLIGYDGMAINSVNVYGQGNTTGATQTMGGKFSWKGVMTRPAIDNGDFGIGSGSSSVGVQGGGGGGYYGGAGNQHGGGSGGSSYISGHLGSNSVSEDSTISNINHLGDSIHYSSKKFVDTIMIDGNGYAWQDTVGNLELMPNPNGGYFPIGSGNNGVGMAKISTVDTLPNDNYLFSLEVSSNGVKKVFQFEPWTQEYTINLEANEADVLIDAIPMDLKADVKNIGEFKVAPGFSDHLITVVAEDGSEKIYTIHFNRIPDSDPYPINIELKRLSANLCKINSSYCQYKFEKDTFDYEIFLPYNTKEIELKTVLKSEWQDVSYKVDGQEVSDATGVFNLNNETTDIEVKITSEDGNFTKTYNYKFKRDMTGNNNLASLTITNPDIEISDFSSDIYEYYLTIPKGYDSYDVNYETESSLATVKVSGNTNLKFGMNDCYVTVTAFNGDKKTYIIHMYKEYEENVLLDSLQVYSDTKELSLTPVFDNKINEYSLKVLEDVKKIRIEAIAEDSNAEVTGIGEVNLISGLNELEVQVSIGDVKNIYKINVYKEKDSNANIRNITVTDYELDKEFKKSEREYYVYLKNGETSIEVNVEMESELATYTVVGNNNLTKTINEIVVTGISEAKTVEIYKIYAVKEISNNNYLASLTSDTGTFNKEFNKEVLDYELNVSSNTDSVNIMGVPEDKKALVEGNGTYYLNVGKNTIQIKVTSEQLEERIYTIVVNKFLDNDTSLKEVRNNRGSEVIKVADNLDYEYLINVQYEVNSIELIGIPNKVTSKVNGNGVYNLVPGNNIIQLEVVAEDGSSLVHNVLVVRDLSNNDDLAFLYVHEGGINPEFKKTTISYDVLLSNEVNLIHVEAIPEDEDSIVSVAGENIDKIKEIDVSTLEENKTLNIPVMVTAKNGSVKVYNLNVLKQIKTEEDLSLKSLEVSHGILDPVFNANVYNYELKVSYDVLEIEVLGVANQESAKVFGNGNYSLNVGKNLIVISVVGSDGIEKDYQIVVERGKSNVASLNNLVVKSHILSPDFQSDVTNYSLKTSLSKLDFTTIEPTEKEASYEVLNNYDLQTGENIVTIRVTAPDGITTKDYVITVTKEGSKNNNLASLSVADHELMPVFHKSVTFYTLDVSNTTNNILIKASAEDSNATITGIGVQTVKTGENYFDIVVTSEAGTTKTYTILVTKEASDNNYLSSLIPSVGEFDSLFDKDVNNYVLELEHDVKELEFYATAEDLNARIVGLDKYKVDETLKDVQIMVISESGKINVYHIVIQRKPFFSAYLQKLKIENYNLIPEFSKENLEYYVEVNNEVTSLDLSYVPLEEGAEVVVDGNIDFVVGVNKITITVTSKNGDSLEYLINVNRQMSTNNYLNSLIISDGELIPDFDKETLTYEVNVASNILEIEVFGTTEDATAKITSGLGVQKLEYGLNTILINVRSQKGIIRTYKLLVTREESINNKLGNILVKKINGDVINATTSFDKELNDYEYNLTERLDYINITTYKDDNYQIVTGDGIKELTSGENIFEVIVTAQNGSINTYTLTINNPYSNNLNVLDIIPSNGSLTPVFANDTLVYDLEVDSAINTLSFEVKLEDNLTVVSGKDLEVVPEGNSTRVIKIIAEDKSEKEYTINIVKKSMSNALLESLEIEGYPIEFDSNTFVYNISVSKSKKELLESEIKAIPKDSEATVNLMGDIILGEDIINVYTIEVIAKDGYTTEEYTLNITRDSEEYTIRSEVYDIRREEVEFPYVIGIEPDTNMSIFKDNFLNDNELLKLYDKNNQLIEEDSKLVGTAMTLKLEKDGYVYDEVKVIVRGDLNYDGKVNGADQLTMDNFIVKIVKFDGYQQLAADITKDGKVNGADQLSMDNYIVKILKKLN